MNDHIPTTGGIIAPDGVSAVHIRVCDEHDDGKYYVEGTGVDTFGVQYPINIPFDTRDDAVAKLNEMELEHGGTGNAQ